MKKKTSDILAILIMSQPEFAPSLTSDTVKRIYQIEERVQFDRDRGDTTSKIKEVIHAELEKKLLEGANDGDDA